MLTHFFDLAISARYRIFVIISYIDTFFNPFLEIFLGFFVRFLLQNCRNFLAKWIIGQRTHSQHNFTTKKNRLKCSEFASEAAPYDIRFFELFSRRISIRGHRVQNSNLKIIKSPYHRGIAVEQIDIAKVLSFISLVTLFVSICRGGYCMP